MDPKTYQQEALKTLSSQFHFSPTQDNCNLLHAAIGIATESGELLDAIKKSTFYGKQLDSVNLREELGDLMWYIAIACESLRTSIDEVCQINIEKLRTRYPEKFTSEAAINRDLEKERKILEKTHD